MVEQEIQNGGVEKVEVAVAASFIVVKPQLLVEASKANDVVQFYKATFGAEQLGRAMHPKHKVEQEIPLILFAQLKLGYSTIVVSDLAGDSAAPDGRGDERMQGGEMRIRLFLRKRSAIPQQRKERGERQSGKAMYFLQFLAKIG